MKIEIEKFPTQEEILKKAEELISNYNGCNDHYVKRSYMIKIVEWVKQELIGDNPSI